MAFVPPPRENVSIYNSLNYTSANTNSLASKLNFPTAQGMETFPNGIQFGDGTVQNTATYPPDISGATNPLTSDLDAAEFDIIRLDRLNVSTVILNSQSGALTELSIASPVDLGGNLLTSVGDPTTSKGAVNVDYLNTQLSSYLPSSTAASTYLTITDASNTYLAIATAAGTYLTITDASNAYETIVDASNTYLRITAAASIYETIANAAATFLTIIDASSTYLTIANAAATYLTSATAAATYLTSAAAAATYLTTSLAASTYLTISNAASTYLTISDASSTFLTIASAASTYLTISNATSTYLSIADAASTYLTISSASSTYAPKASPALTGVPTAPTATSGTNTTQLATTAFVTSAVGGSGGHFQPFFCNVTNWQVPSGGSLGGNYMQGPKFTMVIGSQSEYRPTVFRVTVFVGGQLKTSTNQYFERNSYVSGILTVYPGRFPSTGNWSGFSTPYLFMKGTGGVSSNPPPTPYTLTNNTTVGVMNWEYTSETNVNGSAEDYVYVYGTANQIQFMCDASIGWVTAGSTENYFLCEMEVELLNAGSTTTYATGATGSSYVVNYTGNLT